MWFKRKQLSRQFLYFKINVHDQNTSLQIRIYQSVINPIFVARYKIGKLDKILFSHYHIGIFWQRP